MTRAMSETKDRVRCGWCGTDPLYVAYHDTEWGVPEHDDRKLFELLTLEGAQAGLSWITVLRKRAHYLEALDGFDATKIAAYDQAKLDALLLNPGLVRNRLKIGSLVLNAKAFLQAQQDVGSFDAFLWSFVGGSPKVNRPASLANVPAKTPESDAMSKALAKRGFKFVGSTICYAFMQAAGMVDDHVSTCFRAEKRGEKRASKPRAQRT
jgi:DNA-3-methyladenine glycosylase I